MKPLIVIGTRPEAIKLAPVAKALPEASIALTGQHPADVTMPILEYFGVAGMVRSKLPHMAGLDLPESFGQIFWWLAAVVRDTSCVIGQGDTTTAAAAAQAAYYAGVPFVHVEAGLRTYRATPYPEEFNRRVCALAASVHCCPTERAAENLREERVGGRIEVTGNTVVDAVKNWLDGGSLFYYGNKRPPVTHRPFSYVSCHRRENWGSGFSSVEDAVEVLARTYDGFCWILHPNPALRPRPIENVFMNPPMSYPDSLRSIYNSGLIITDSGGIQEEAAILGRPCLVLRESTERPEANGILVGTDTKTIVDTASRIIDEGFPSPPPHGLGDGHAGEKIANIVRELTNSQPCQASPALTAIP